MKKEKKIKKTTVDAQAEEKEQQAPDAVDVEDNNVEVNDPGDCIGHWAVCEECEMCEIQDSCQAMTRNINEEGEDNAEEK